MREEKRLISILCFPSNTSIRDPEFLYLELVLKYIYIVKVNCHKHFKVRLSNCHNQCENKIKMEIEMNNSLIGVILHLTTQAKPKHISLVYII